MEIFSSKGKSTQVWGPIASCEVKSGALGKIDGWILEGVTIGAKEIVDVRQCFGDVSYIYALGNDQSRCSVILSFVVFVGSHCGKKENTYALEDGIKQYAAGRISSHKSPEPVGIGLFARNGWLTGIDVGQFDPSKGICHASVHFIIELSGKG